MSQKKTIGIQIDYIEGGVADTVWPEVFRTLEDDDYHVLVFVGRSLRSPIPLDYQYNRIYNFIDHKNLDGLLVLAGLDTFTFPEEHDQIFKEFGDIPKVSVGSYYPDIPSVITNNRQIICQVMEHLWLEHRCRNIAFISGPSENFEARERQKGYLDFFEKYEIPVDPALMVEGGDYLDYSGAAGVVELLDGKKVSFDAIICSSDTQAFGAAQELTRRGIRIPQDVSLFGFDDIPETRSNPLGLSTVKIPLSEMVRQGMDLLEKRMEGLPIEPEYQVPSSLVLRSSCGCFSENIICWDQMGICDDEDPSSSFPRERLEPFFKNYRLKESFLGLLESKITHLLNSENLDVDTMQLLAELNQQLDLDTLEEVGIRSWHALLTILGDWVFTLQLESKKMDSQRYRSIQLAFQKARVLLADKQTYLQNSRSKETLRLTEIIRILSQRFIFTSDLSQVEFALRETLIPLGVKNLRVYLFEGEEQNKERKYYLPLPKYCRPVITITQGQNSAPAKRKVRSQNLLHSENFYQNSMGYLVLPLFQTEELLGCLMVEPGPWNGDFYMNLVYLLSSALKSVLLFQSQQEYQRRLKQTLKQLEDSNDKLKEQTRVDSFTGLYNRRGFYLLAENSLKLIRRLERRGMLFYGDMDGLKIINDNWGHKAGDDAINGAAWALTQTFRGSDIIARFGGDEFVIMTIDTAEEDISDILKRLNKNLDKVNKESRGYKVSISLGYVMIDKSNAHLNLDELLHRADKFLYQEKQLKKS